MSPNAPQNLRPYPHDYSPTDVDSQTTSNPELRDDLGFANYMISQPPPLQAHGDPSLHTSQTHHQQHLPLEIVPPISQYPEFRLPYQNSIRNHVSGHDNSLDGRIESPETIKGSYDSRVRGSNSEVSERRASIASMGQHRSSVGSVGKGGFPPRHGSIDGSEVTSPTSSRGLGQQGSDESIPQLGSASQNDGMGEDSKSLDAKGKPPPWSELKTKAGKERKRLPLACIACRRKKIRCSGEKPACKHCLRSRIPCVYKVTTRKAAPRTDYMAMLDKRLKRMEERVIKIIPVHDTNKLSNIGRANVKPVAAQPPKANGAKKRAADEAFANDIDEWAQSGTQSGLSRAHGHNRHSSGLDLSEHRLLTEGAEYLPAREIQEHLAEVFFDCLYGQSYHLLHKPSFMRRLRAGTVPPVLILAVCAIAARFSTHPQVNTEPAFLRGEPWAKPARDIVLRRYDEPNITILTVLLILGLHEFGTCQGGRSWMLGGMAMRMAYALQLHKELDHDPLGRKQDKSTELSFTDREIRRRTMWACFLMDRFNSSGTERPPVAVEESIEVQLPIKESYFQMEVPGPTESLDGSVPNPVSPDAGQISNPKDNMGVASYFIRIIAIWGRVIKYLNLGGMQRDQYPIWHKDSQFIELKRQAAEYLTSLPETLKYNPENLQAHAAEKIANQFLLMHIAYNQVVLFLHKFAIPTSPGGRTTKEYPNDFVSDAAQTTIEAAGTISSLLNETSQYLVAAPFVGYCAFVSSTVHVWGIFSKIDQLEASSKRNLAYNVKYLSKMKKYWGMFHYMAENLKDIYRQHADAALKGPNACSSVKPDGSIFQYGDWFNKYPHGVSGIDYEDPATEIKRESGNDAALSQKSDLQSVEEFFNTLSPPARIENQRKVSKRQGTRGSMHLDQQASQRIPNLKTEPHNLPLQQKPPPHHQPMLSNMPSHSHHQNRSPLDHSDAYTRQDLYHPSHPTFPPNTFAPPQHQHTQIIPMHQGVLLQDLDRQLVFDAYASTDPTASASAADLNNLTLSHSNAGNGMDPSMWDSQVDFSNLGPGQGFGGEMNSSAWFMPFNLHPPDVGADGEFIGLGGYGIDVDGGGMEGGQG